MQALVCTCVFYAGVVVWLNGPTDLLAKRVAKEGIEKRPLLASPENANPSQEELYQTAKCVGCKRTWWSSAATPWAEAALWQCHGVKRDNVVRAEHQSSRARQAIRGGLLWDLCCLRKQMDVFSEMAR